MSHLRDVLTLLLVMLLLCHQCQLVTVLTHLGAGRLDLPCRLLLLLGFAARALRGSPAGMHQAQQGRVQAQVCVCSWSTVDRLEGLTLAEVAQTVALQYHTYYTQHVPATAMLLHALTTIQPKPSNVRFDHRLERRSSPVWLCFANQTFQQ